MKQPSRREFVVGGSLAVVPSVFVIPKIKNIGELKSLVNEENPKGLPVAEFAPKSNYSGGYCCNYEEILKDVPWERYKFSWANDYDRIKRSRRCWIRELDAIMNYWATSTTPAARPSLLWGEMELFDIWTDNGFRYTEFKTLPETKRKEASRYEEVIHGGSSSTPNVKWQDQGIIPHEDNGMGNS